MKSEKVTISDIAEALNISAITVSRALSGQAGVGNELRDKIAVRARELGYIKSKSIGDVKILILHQKPYVQDNSNFSHIVQGIESAIQGIGAEYNVEFIDKDSQDKMMLPGKITKCCSFDGIIFIGRFNNDYVDFLKQRVKNQVFYGGYNPSFDCDSVRYNFYNGGYKECLYLINKGHTNIAFLGNESFGGREKAMGITSALKEHGLPVFDEFYLFPGNDFEDEFARLLEKDNKPSVMGSGNTEMSGLSIPSLTTLNLNIEYSCKSAVDLLLKRINNPDKPYESIVINSVLVERDSVRDLSSGGR